MSHMLLEESNERMETNPEEKDASEILKNLNKTIKINLYDNINIFFDKNIKYIFQVKKKYKIYINKMRLKYKK